MRKLGPAAIIVFLPIIAFLIYGAEDCLFQLATVDSCVAKAESVVHAIVRLMDPILLWFTEMLGAILS